MAVHRGNRHGRSEEARLAVLEAADDLLVEKGFARLTVEGIAQRAGVAKQTIYRWWPSKTDILLEAFVTDAAEELTPPDTGDLTRDLVAHLGAIGRFLTASDAGAVFRALAAQGQHDPRLAARLREEHLTHQRNRDRQPLERALQRGELPAETDLDTLVDRLVGPLYYRALVTGQEITEAFVVQLIKATLQPHDADAQVHQIDLRSAPTNDRSKVPARRPALEASPARPAPRPHTHEG